MSDHKDEMWLGVERRENAKLVPDSYSVSGDALEGITDALQVWKEVDPTFHVRLALNEDGSPTAFFQIVVDGETVYCGNDAFPCPPFCG